MNTRVYITTPIYYANGLPHIGHLLTTTCADVLSRHYRLLLGKENVFFTTGLDEHGTTVEQSAKKEGISDYQSYVDDRADFWQKAFTELEISYDYFVRTTHPKHVQFAQDFIRKLVKNGDVYKASYTGKYCSGCEKFLTLSDLNEDGLCPLHRPDQVTEVKEENYFFKLSAYSEKIKELIESDTLHIYPEQRKKDILARISQGVGDQSISRPKEKVAWAIEFPDDSAQTVYVWVEALLNYLSSLEINGKQDFWDVAVHFVGKDISWFHNVIWPAMLLSAGYAPHKAAFVHSILNLGGQKISKSLGNVITPADLIELYGIDGARYVVLANTPYRDDTDVTKESLTARYNSDLANGLGNLVSRVAKLAEGIEVSIKSPQYTKLVEENPDITKAYEEFRFQDVVGLISEKVRHANEWLNQNTPWKKEGEEKATLIRESIRQILEIAVLLEPVTPESSRKIQEILTGKNESGNIQPLFQRIV